MSIRRRILMIQPSLQPPGGGNGVAAWMLEALRGRHDLGVLTWRRLDLDEMNRFYGTSILPADVTVERLPAWTRIVDAAIPFRAQLLKNQLLVRAAAASASRYDVLISSNNETDFGRCGVQYIHYPSHRRPRPAGDYHWFHHIPMALPLYYRLADTLAGYSADRAWQNITLVNSDWTRARLEEVHGVQARTLYPPIATVFEDLPWQERVAGFICVGRFSPEKNLDRVIDIASEVRRRVPGVTLCLAGSGGPPWYLRHLRDRARMAGEWISIKENLTRAELVGLLPTYRYGIHGMTAEHFGMAPAEMAAAGCIVFVPNDGGQVEIVGRDPRLMYGTVQEAVETIAGIMNDPAAQTSVRARLKQRAQMFSAERFMTDFREIVERAPTHAIAP